MEEKRIIEINGLKVEVDMRSARKIDTFRVGDNVKLLVKEYGGSYKVYPGIITGFDNFKDLPTIVVAVYKDTFNDVTIEFYYVNEKTAADCGYDLILSGDDELKVSRDSFIQRFEAQIEKKKNELSDLEHKLDFFKTHFLYQVPNREVEA